MTRISEFDPDDWSKHTTCSPTELVNITLSEELTREVDGFARWQGISREQLVYGALVAWMKDH